MAGPGWRAATVLQAELRPAARRVAEGNLRRFLTRTLRASPAMVNLLMAIAQGKVGPALGPDGDQQCIAAFAEKFSPEQPAAKARGAENLAGRAAARVAHVRRLFQNIWPGPGLAYLDVGCGDGTITRALGQALGAKYLGCDICRRPDSVLGPLLALRDGPIPLGDGSQHIVSYFMSLHHVPDQAAELREARRVLRPDGLLIIREHDCPGPGFACFLDWVHAIYAVAVRRGKAPGEFCRGFRARYRDKKGLEADLASAGFRTLATFEKGEWTRGFYLLAAPNR